MLLVVEVLVDLSTELFRVVTASSRVDFVHRRSVLARTRCLSSHCLKSLLTIRFLFMHSLFS